MGVTTTKTNKPLNPRGNDQSPLAYNRAKLYSGKALDFDGVNDKVTTTYASGFTGAQEFTYCAYVYVDSVSGNRALVHANENTTYGLQSLQLRDGVFRFYAGTGSSATSYVDSELAEINKWYFVVGTHTATENKIYLNGVLNGTANGASLTIAPDEIVVGAYPTDVLNFNGKIANVKVFSTALTAAQVADLYNNPEKVVPTGVNNTALKLWLPMMEGAGTTAYDGSGNGNHGTISGATYVNGVGAPVAQSAVMNWNKGTNLLTYSEDFTEWTLEGSASLTANATTAPSGESNASKLIAGASSARQSVKLNVTKSGDLVYSVYAKKGEYDVVQFTDARDPNLYANFDLTNGVVGDSDVATPSIENIGDGWYRCSVSYNAANDIISVRISIAESPTSARLVNFAGNGSDGIYIWGASLEEATAIGSYVETIGTAQTSDVLLPQGLTTGRDITGVNLFENVRKQGALNLDGNSWAEVHDNASLDVTTGVSVECWYYHVDQNTTKGIFGKWIASSSDRSYTIYMNPSNKVAFTTSNDGVATLGQAVATSSFADDNWYHVLGTFDGSNVKIYVNGTIETTTSASGSIYNSDVPVAIGHINGTLIYDHPIAQPRIYNRALTAEEVQRSYDSGKNIYTNS